MLFSPINFCTWRSFGPIVRMKPLNDFFFETDVRNTGTDMVSYFDWKCRWIYLGLVLSHEFINFLFFLRNRFVFVLFTWHRRPPFLDSSEFCCSPVTLVSLGLISDFNKLKLLFYVNVLQNIPTFNLLQLLDLFFLLPREFDVFCL